MRRLSLGLWAVIIGLLGLTLAPAGAQNLPPIIKVSGQVPDEVLVRVAPGNTLDELAAQVGGRVLKRFANINWQQVKLPKGLNVSQALAHFRGKAGVLAVEPNYTYTAAAVPNDAGYRYQWDMAKIGAPSAWDTTTGTSGVVVAVLDTGITYTHPDLADNMWRNPGEIAGNGADDDGNGYLDDVYGIDTLYHDGDPLDDHGHGTHVAGTIGAVGNNGQGVAGVNWSVKLMALKFIGKDDLGTTAGAIEAYQYAIAMKGRGVNIRVINNSWTGIGNSTALRDVMASAEQAGIVSVCAAGNNARNTDITANYPAGFSNTGIIAVAASDQSDNVATFSNYGATSVDLAAPGVSIYSTMPSGYATMNGTSMAAPHVSGAAALLFARMPGWSVAQVKSALLQSVDKSSTWSGRVLSGGRLNVARAMQVATGVPITPQPQVKLTLTVSPTAPGRVGVPATFTAGGLSGSMQYQWRLGYPTSVGYISYIMRLYSPATTLIWTPARAGNYTVEVWARPIGSTQAYTYRTTLAYPVQ